MNSLDEDTRELLEAAEEVRKLSLPPDSPLGKFVLKVLSDLQKYMGKRLAAEFVEETKAHGRS